MSYLIQSFLLIFHAQNLFATLAAAIQTGFSRIPAMLFAVIPEVCAFLRLPLGGMTFFQGNNSVLLSASWRDKLIADFVWMWDEILSHWVGLTVFILALFFVTGLAAFAVVLVFRMLTRKKLAQLTYLDQVTGCDNYAAFTLKAESLLKNGAQYAYVMFDINRFKAINSSYGFQEGNCLLLLVSQQLKEFTRCDELFSRSSDDNFTLLLQYESIEQLTQRLNALFVKMKYFYSTRKKLEYQVNYACGVFLITEPDVPLVYCHGNAQLAKRSVKNLYDTAIFFYDDSLRKRIIETQEIEASMYNALANREFEVYLQPKYELSTDSIVGAEALIRWHHPTMGFLSPARFIPILEQNGFLLRLDCYVHEEVCRTIRSWLDAGETPFPISVNMSRLHARQQDFVERIEETAGRYQVSPELIEIELTETAFHDDTQQIIDVMQRLKEKGFRVAMDDFGSGYSSLNLLNVLPVDIIKLDRMMFRDLEKQDRSKKIVTNAIHIVRDLEMKVVAEGIETQEQIDFLRNIECDMVQGYFYARPMPVPQFEMLAFSRIINTGAKSAYVK